ncbi:hypothetical protein ACL00X_10935 [Aeromonas diversa]|uniref:hypothetical protein n=1 Tax=Aeromonas diversa TaxID=502790 RepID=UPI00399FAC97
MAGLALLLLIVGAALITKHFALGIGPFLLGCWLMGGAKPGSHETVTGGLILLTLVLSGLWAIVEIF